VVIDSTNVLVRSEEQVVAVIGLKDLVVVATGGRRAGR
jgi:mannose-1-phosphate guanylyltransferase